MHHDTAVLIGRFQPFHLGHAALLAKAFETAPQVVVVLGSAHAAPSPRNAFTADEREAMIRSTLSPDQGARVRFVRQRDVWNTVRWAREVRAAVEAPGAGKVALVGYHKDSTSEYLHNFQGWDLVDPGRLGPIDGTPLRERILSDVPWEEVASEIADRVPGPVVEWLGRWAAGSVRQELAEDRRAIGLYRESWGDGPFLTVDAVVRCRGHVLLIRRGARPGKGLLALPGGFLESRETMESGARRELLEETGLRLEGVGASREVVFSHPGRSQRARIVTHAFLFEPDWAALPPVEGADDAVDARWIPEETLVAREAEFFSDHFHILEQMLGLPTLLAGG